jgi:hypothetical protein
MTDSFYSLDWISHDQLLAALLVVTLLGYIHYSRQVTKRNPREILFGGGKTSDVDRNGFFQSGSGFVVNFGSGFRFRSAAGIIIKTLKSLNAL